MPFSHRACLCVCVCTCGCVCVCVFLCPSVCVLSFTINFFLFLRCIKNARQTQTQEKAGDFKSFTILFIFFLCSKKCNSHPHLTVLINPYTHPHYALLVNKWNFNTFGFGSKNPKNMTNQNETDP